MMGQGRKCGCLWRQASQRQKAAWARGGLDEAVMAMGVATALKHCGWEGVS